MNAEKLRFGIIGPGTVAHLHCQAIRQAQGAELTAVYGRNAEKTAAFARQYGLKAYTDLEAFLASPEFEAVSIATASGAHLDPGVRAAQAGKHILCEKPLEVTSRRAEALISSCARHRVKLGVFFQARFDESTRLAKAAITQGRLGKLLLASCQMRWYRSQAYYDSAPWRGTWALDGGGCLMNQGIHTLDLLLHLVGEPLGVCAFKGPVSHERIEVEDTLCASVRFVNGAIGTIEASTSCAPGFPRRVEISGEQGTIGIEDNRIVRWSFAEEQPGDAEISGQFSVGAATLGGAADPTAIDVNGHRLLVEDFVASVRNRSKPLVDGAEGKKAVDFVCAIYASMRSGSPTHLA
jgi:UDP-N-acetyl-2-amino-2-deoxyglucuronate dehydrogenase